MNILSSSAGTDWFFETVNPSLPIRMDFLIHPWRLGIRDGFPNTSLILVEHGYNLLYIPSQSRILTSIIHTCTIHWKQWNWVIFCVSWVKVTKFGAKDGKVWESLGSIGRYLGDRSARLIWREWRRSLARDAPDLEEMEDFGGFFILLQPSWPILQVCSYWVNWGNLKVRLCAKDFGPNEPQKMLRS